MNIRHSFFSASFQGCSRADGTAGCDCRSDGKRRPFFPFSGKRRLRCLPRKLQELPTDRTQMEFMAQITLNGKPSQCQTAILVSGKKDSEGHYSSLLGKIVDIDENYKRIQMYDAEAAKPALQKQVLLKFMRAVLTLFYQAQRWTTSKNQPLRSWWYWIRFIYRRIV